MSKRQLLGFAKVLATFVVIWILAFIYSIVGCANIEGGEMSPTVQKGRKLIDPAINDATQFEYDDLIVYRYVLRDRVLDKAGRVVGVPGDKIRMEEGKVFVNDTEISSDYVSPSQTSKDNYEEVIVPRGTVFVLCDARRMGIRLDSREIGPVGEWAIVGRLR